MAENNTNLFLEILHSFDAGEYFLCGPYLHLKKKSNQLPGIQVIINTGIETLLTILKDLCIQRTF